MFDDVAHVNKVEAVLVQRRVLQRTDVDRDAKGLSRNESRRRTGIYPRNAPAMSPDSVQKSSIAAPNVEGSTAGGPRREAWKVVRRSTHRPWRKAGWDHAGPHGP